MSPHSLSHPNPGNYRYCSEVDGPKLANMIEFGVTPVLSPSELQELGYSVAAYPITLLSVSIRAMKEALVAIKSGNSTDGLVLPFTEVQKDVGFQQYYDDLDRYNNFSS